MLEELGRQCGIRDTVFVASINPSNMSWKEPFREAMWPLDQMQHDARFAVMTTLLHASCARVASQCDELLSPAVSPRRCIRYATTNTQDVWQMTCGINSFHLQHACLLLEVHQLPCPLCCH